MMNFDEKTVPQLRIKYFVIKANVGNNSNSLEEAIRSNKKKILKTTLNING